MRRNRFALKAAPFVITAALTAACGGSQPAAPAPAAEKITPTVAQEMSPEEAGGMAPAPEANAPAKAPHGGTVVKLGTAACLEFVHDPSSGTLTAYVLNPEATATMRLPAKAIAVEVAAPGGKKVDVSLASTANGLTGDTVGNSSQFGGAQPALKGVTAFTGVVKQVDAGGKAFTNIAFSYPLNPA